ncbi:MAG: methyl-accepting chemotaxis protein [Treponema sp.]|nr:methyl-accepting chemotaxis protein [Treponema sp.]
MKLKFKLSLLVIGIMTVVVAGIAVLLLIESSGITRGLSIEKMHRLVAEQAEYWKGQQERRLQVLRSLAYVMNEYESIPADERRERFDNMLSGTIISEPDLINLYVVWKPNSIDGMDAAFIDRVGSGPDGQYAITYTREDGDIDARTTTDIPASMAYITGPNSKRDRIEHPIPRHIDGRDTYLLRMMVPIINSRTNETVGGVGCLMDIDAIQQAVTQVVKTYEEIAAMVMYSGNGMIMGHLAPDQVGSMIDVEAIYGEHVQDAKRAVLSGEMYTCNSFSPRLNTNMEIVMVPIRFGNSDNVWSVMVTTPEAHIMKEVNRLTTTTVIVAAIAIAITAIILFLVLSSVTRPVAKVADTLKDISEGEGDLTKQIIASSKDEIGDLSRYFNLTLEKIKNLVFAIKKEASTLSDIGSDLASNMSETAAAVNEITANIQSIKTRIINQSASVTETNATMEQITVNIDRLNGHVERQSASVDRSSSAIEQMIANIQSVTQTLVKNGDNVNELTDASEDGRNGLQEVAADIQEIARESEGLLEINSVMENIASQTNLLSMNAAIEAAHAGEAGKGFAVVADEIRKLAENSSEQSKTISTVLKKIKASIDKITSSTDNVLRKFEAIDRSVRTVAEQEENIRNAMEEQGQGSKQILEAIGAVNEITGQVKGGSTEMLEGSSEVIRESKNLERATQEITTGMNEMALGADQINTAVHSVNDLCGKNQHGIDNLIKEVSKFKVE